MFLHRCGSRTVGSEAASFSGSGVTWALPAAFRMPVAQLACGRGGQDGERGWQTREMD